MTDNLPMLPNPSAVVPDDTISAERLRALLEQLGRDDPEVGHIVEDDAVRAVLRAIRDGHPDPAGLARAMLTVTEARFPRWMA